MPTLIFEDRFDTGGTWAVSSGSPTIGTSPLPPDGSPNSLQIDALNEYVIWEMPDSGFTRAVFGVWIYIDALGTANPTRIFKIDSGPSEGWMRVVNGTGIPRISGDGTPTISSTDGPGGSNFSADTWTWAQFMFDVSANPWEIRGNVNGQIWSATGAAAASNLNSGNFMLGNTSGEVLTVYYGHPKGGVAASDNDWWEVPTGAGLGDNPPFGFHGRGAGW